jgi:methyltransferase (TIGR00027 family)
LFEIDLPEMLTFKDEVLGGRDAQPTCTRTAFSADLTGDWPPALVDAGFDRSQPTAWLVEGLLVYLTHGDAARLLDAVGALSAPGSRISSELGRGAKQLAQIANVRAATGGSEAVALWQGGIEDLPAWFTDHGWSVEQHDLGDLARAYGRPVTSETSSGFVIARRS